MSLFEYRCALAAWVGFIVLCVAFVTLYVFTCPDAPEPGSKS